MFDNISNMEGEQLVGEILARPYVRLALIILCLLMIGFLAAKAGFSLWVLSTLNLNQTEHLSACPPGKNQNILGVCR